MLFVDTDFLFQFLPIVLVVYWLTVRFAGTRLGVAWLVLASFVFYAWWKPPFLALLLASIGVNYVLGRRIVDPEKRARSRTLLITGVAFNLLLIAYFKYANFFLDNLGALAGSEWRIESLILPIGISFYTFQQIAYLADCYRDGRCETSLANYALFVSFFPQLIAGPIVHHKQVLPQFASGEQSQVATRHRVEAINLFVIALAKKLVLADTFSLYSSQVFDLADAGTTLSFGEAWLGILAYTFQIYFDFSAYSEMAIAMGLFMGIRLPVNFASPYKAASITEFWRRWHMTLSGFLRDYLYIPLGGNRHGKWLRYRNLFATMLLGGLWHGASWNFVLWGGLHGLFLTVHHAWQALGLRMPEALGRVVTFLSVALAWCFFRATTMGGGRSVVASALGLHGFAPGEQGGLAGFFPSLAPEGVLPPINGLGATLLDVIPLPYRDLVESLVSVPIQGFLWVGGGAVIAFFLLSNLEWSKRPAAKTPMGAAILAILLFIIVLSSLGGEPGEFIYFQF